MTKPLPLFPVTAQRMGYETLEAAAAMRIHGLLHELAVVPPGALGDRWCLVTHQDCNPDKPDQGASSVIDFDSREEAVEAFESEFNKEYAVFHGYAWQNKEDGAFYDGKSHRVELENAFIAHREKIRKPAGVKKTDLEMVCIEISANGSTDAPLALELDGTLNTLVVQSGISPRTIYPLSLTDSIDFDYQSGSAPKP